MSRPTPKQVQDEQHINRVTTQVERHLRQFFHPCEVTEDPTLSTKTTTVLMLDIPRHSIVRITISIEAEDQDSELIPTLQYLMEK